MDTFGIYLTMQGMDNVDELESFLNGFVKNPALITNLTVKERTDLESQMDAALSLLENPK